MSRNGSGTYSLPAGNPVVSGSTISSTWANNTLTDIATALSGSIAADGQTPITGALQMNSNQINGLANGTASTDAINLSQLTAISSTLGTMAIQNANAVVITGGSVAVGSLSATSDVNFTSTGFLLIPSGTTAQRPVSPTVGEIRYNTSYSQFEGYANGAWGQLGGGATGAGGDTVFVENSKTVTTSYTLTTNKNAESVGPITINSGVTVTVPSGARWVVL